MENIKRIIFDLDNTLIIWKKEYIECLRKTMEEFNVNDEYYEIIDGIIESQEKLYDILKKEVLLNDINRKCNTNLDIHFIDRLFTNQKYAAPENDINLIDTIEYLYSKYELVVLSNYFTEAQKNRLEYAKILKYFKYVLGGDMTRIKPHKEAFLLASKGLSLEQCLMVGDSKYYDVDGASQVGMKVIQVDYFNKVNEETSYPVIKDIKELKKLL